MTIAAPMNEEELRNIMFTAQLHNNGPFSIRYPRGRGVMTDWRKPYREIPVGKARELRKGFDLAVLTVGHVGNLAEEAILSLEAENYSISHFDMRFVKPLDTDCLHQVFKDFNHIITIEDGTIVGGFGSAVIEFMCENGYQAHVKRMGVPDKFIEQGNQEELYKACGFDADGICETVKTMIKPGVFQSSSRQIFSQ